MASTSRRTRPPLIDCVQSEASRFHFLQAVRVLEQNLAFHSNGDGKVPRRPVGRDHAPSREVLRFRSDASLRFPAGPIVKVQPERNGKQENTDWQDETDEKLLPRLEMLVSFMGLTGPSGVLPQHYTVRMIRAARNKERSMRDFFDMFNHRLISLFYRASEKHSFPLSYERVRVRREGEDAVTQALYSLVGLGTKSTRERMAVDDETIVHYSGHFARSPRSAVALVIMLQDRFGVQATVEQFRGQWLALASSDRSLMPCEDYPRGLNNQLGKDMIAGSRVWDVQSRFRVRLGPLKLEEFTRFTAMGDQLAPMCAAIRLFVGPELDFDVQPVLRADAVPQSKLGGDPETGARLGWTTWIGGGQRSDDFDEAAFYVEYEGCRLDAASRRGL